MKPSRACYLVCGACVAMGATGVPPALIFAVVTGVLALVFDQHDL